MDKFRRIIGILLIIIGVVIIGDVAYKKIITLNKQKEIVKLFENGFSDVLLQENLLSLVNQ